MTRLLRLRMRFALGPLPAALMFCVALPSVATADEAPAYERMSLEELLQVPVVVTASRQEESANDAPATTVVITREEIRLRGYAFLKDVLRDVPGMETQEYSFSTFGTRVPVRGVVGNNKILLLVNGMRVNPPGGEDAVMRSDMSVRDAEQIEIVFGPGSTLYGQDAISAVINIITRHPGPENVHVNKDDARDRLLGTPNIDRQIVNFGMEFGYPLQKELWGSLNLNFGEAHLYGSVHYIDKQLTDLSGAYPEFWSQQVATAAGRGLALDPNRYDTGLNVFFRFQYKNASIQLWHRQSARNVAEGFGLPVSVGYVNESRWADMSTVMQARFDLPIGKYFTLESLLTFNHYEVDPSSRFVTANPVLPGQAPTWNLDNYKYARGTSGTLEERLVFRWASQLQVTAGFFAGYYDITPSATIPGGADTTDSISSLSSDAIYYTTKGDPNSQVIVERVNPVAYQDFGGYLEGNWRIMKMLRLVVGMRIDKNTSVDELALSPRASLIFNYQSFTAKYIFARAFVAPPPAYKYNIFQNATEFHGPNPELQPETTISNELFLGYAQRHFNLGISFYYNLQDNLLIQSSQPINFVRRVWLDPQGMREVDLTQAANEGQSQAIGADFFGKWNIWRLTGWASYSFTSFSSTVSGMVYPMVGLSKHNFRFGTTVNILKNLHATAGIMVKSTPEGIAQPDVLAGLIGVPWEINAHILYSPIPAVDLYADFRNLTNHKYYLPGQNGPYPVQAFQGTGGLRLAF